ncbi:HAD-IA family hydrolase [Pontixanthobacter aquaemixtae]|uniref:HAD-IA family hydrolase n=1 Tax=Pontixanthobacter aquaemixtae TaxID=1958940 RepID=A0A844ZX14_9SPHN|nr:HAD-IA family hydrolase [Pontixanthobacter aquaemixtae]MXO91720.1 HAD-IA family hydrolase [Pontixanthobacter aquaemixtae]
MSQPQVKAAVFDVGRVIVQWDIRLLYAKLIDDADRLDWFLANVVTEPWHMQHDAGRPIAEMVEERKELFPDYASLIDLYQHRFLETIPARVPGTASLIERLHESGIPLYAITNFGADFWAQFRPTEPLFDLFRDIVVSGQEHMVKPSPEIFRLAEDRFAMPASAMLFIDDNVDNIAAADALGWCTHHFRNAALLERDLEARGLIG